MTLTPDFELLRAWRQGDRNAANELMGRYYAGIHRFFTAKVPHVADDLTQQSLLACVEGHTAIRDGASFRSYLFGIAWRKLLDHLRQRDRNARLVEAQVADGPVAGLTPSGVIAQREEQQLLLQAMGTLPPESHITVMLFYWEGMSTAEIGGVLDISVTSVTSRLSRARERLRKAVDDLATRPASRESLLGDLEGWARSLVAGQPSR